MLKNDYDKLFGCQECGRPTSIYLIKNSGSKVIIKHRCPEHGGDKFTVPFEDKNLYLDLIHNGIYRCFECGQQASLYSVEFTGPWALLSCYCPTHGADVKTQKIWSSFFLELQNQGSISDMSKQESIKELTPEPESQNEEPEPPSEQEEKLTCPNCGVELHGNEKFCGSCGMDLTNE